ncbi:MAG: protein kinase [Gemmatimonadetes bacterium]|nr:protein kinase [Gemmatimonadota bacterium]
MAKLEERLRAALADRYAIEREVGQGGMATVFLARDLRHDRKVAVKVLRPELAAAVGHERFVREIKIAAQLQHPHILPLHDSGEAEGFLYYVMPYVEGESLRDRISREGELPVSDAIRILSEVADALSFAHARGVVHRDIKPDNVMISGRHSLVMDFGVAKAVSEAADAGELTSAGVALGTPAYMAPEQAAADEHVDHRVDIYALGVLAYELLTGRPPFSGGSAQQVLSAQVTQKPVPVIEYRESIPPLLAEIVMKCLEKHSADRWQSADELRSELERVATPSQGVSASQTPAGAAAWAPGLSRRLKRTVGVGVIALAALLVLILRPFGTGAPAADVSPTTVAVLPFSVSGGDDFGYLSEAMVSLLSTKLDGAGDLRSVDPRTLLSVAAREFGNRLDPQQGRRLAQRFGAGIYIMGDVVEAGGRLRITASVYETDGDAVPVAEATADGGSEELFTLVDELASQLLVSLAGGPGARVTRIAGVTTSSLPAFKAYLEGESAFRNGNFGDAVEAFQRAVAIDTMFALGYYRLSVAAEWDLHRDKSVQAAERASELAARLPNRDRRLLEALRLLRRGRHGEAEARYRSLVASYPDDVEAWLELGEVLFHSNSLHGRSFTESREPFERVLTYEPNHGTAMIHLARIAAYEKRLDDLDSLAGVELALYPEGDRALEIEALRGLSHGDLESESRVEALLQGASAPIIALVSQITGAYAHNLQGPNG